MEEKLLNWAKETYDIYSALAKGDDIGFYSQTPLCGIKEPVKVVVMGINPGSGGSFSNMKEGGDWGFGKLGKEEAYWHLMRGNVCWQEEHTAWCYWNIVMNLLSKAYPGIKENEDKECVFTNATFFNSTQAKGVPEELYQKTLPCTLKLIEILSPEMVISLSPDNFDRMVRALHNDFKHMRVFDRGLILGEYKDILFVSIYHPSPRNMMYSIAYKNLVKKALAFIREKRNLPMDEIVASLQKSLQEEWNAVKNGRKA